MDPAEKLMRALQETRASLAALNATVAVLGANVAELKEAIKKQTPVPPAT
ncbi:hypothetical protein [Paracraurococcus ruber]|nr:hypothetical protein [Paracraurococcus ruber]